MGVVDFYFDQVLSRVDLSRADHKKIAATRIVGIISRLKTEIEQSHYIKLLSQKLDIPEKILTGMITRSVSVPVEEKEQGKQAQPSSNAALMSEHLIGFVGVYDTYLPLLFEEVEPDMMAEDIRELYKTMILQYTETHESSLRTFSNKLNENELRVWSELVFKGEQTYAALTAIEREREFHLLVSRLKREYYTRRLHELTLAIERAENEGRSDDIKELVAQHQRVLRMRSDLLS